MALLEQLVLVLFGLAAIAFGVKCIVQRGAKVSWNWDSDEPRVYEGLPAVLIGLVSIGLGLWLVLSQVA